MPKLSCAQSSDTDDERKRNRFASIIHLLFATRHSTEGVRPSDAPVYWYKSALTSIKVRLYVAKLGCTNTLANYTNTNVNGGAPYAAANSVDDCYWACVANSSCKGFDWGPAAAPRCWFTLPSSGQRNNGTATGIMHYDLIRCSGGM